VSIAGTVSRVELAIAAGALLLIGLYVAKRGGLVEAAKGAGAAVVDAAGAAASGAVGAIGASAGLPTPDETTTDPAVARWLIDNAGQLAASKWASAGAYLRAQLMAAGSGTAPAPGSTIAKAFPSASYDESDRLLKRYPAPDVPAPVLDINDPTSWGLGA
jgi:hypothetical protein